MGITLIGNQTSDKEAHLLMANKELENPGGELEDTKMTSHTTNDGLNQQAN